MHINFNNDLVHFSDSTLLTACMNVKSNLGEHNNYLEYVALLDRLQHQRLHLILKVKGIIPLDFQVFSQLRNG
jgi:hypothetical protein